MVAAGLAISLAGCEYSGPDEPPAPSSPPPATPSAASFKENVNEVARLLGASPADPGMPLDAEPAGKLSLDLAPGDYLVTGACAGVYGAEVLAPVQVPCGGSVFKAPVVLPTEGADLTMGPGGLDSRFAYRLVPTGRP